jgi:hypothetical protein
MQADTIRPDDAVRSDDSALLRYIGRDLPNKRLGIEELFYPLSRVELLQRGLSGDWEITVRLR